MKISTKGRYGLRLMIELALVYQQRLLPLKVVAKNQDISDKYLEQIIAPLGKSGLVVSVRGAQGGYALSRGPSEITVRDILRAVEGGLALVDCLGDGCERKSSCMANGVWQRLQAALEETAQGITLADIISEAHCYQE